MYVNPQATEPACDMHLAAKGAAVVATRRRHRTSPTGSRETRSRLCAAPPLPPSRARTTRLASESPLRLAPGPASYRSSAVLPCVSEPHFTAPPRGLASQLQGLAGRLAVKCPACAVAVPGPQPCIFVALRRRHTAEQVTPIPAFLYQSGSAAIRQTCSQAPDPAECHASSRPHAPGLGYHHLTCTHRAAFPAGTPS